jgi:hypothetical protein
MKLSTLTTDFVKVLDYLEINNKEIYNSILGQLLNDGNDKDDIRLVTIIKQILDYFLIRKDFQKLFDYSEDQIEKLLFELKNNQDSYNKVWNEIVSVTDLSKYQVKANIFNDENHLLSIVDYLSKDFPVEDIEKSLKTGNNYLAKLIVDRLYIDSKFIRLFRHTTLERELLYDVLEDPELETIVINAVHNQIIEFRPVQNIEEEIEDVEEENWDLKTLKFKLTEKYGPENKYTSSADWGGIPVWSVGPNSGLYEGYFVGIGDYHEVFLLKRTFDEQNEENIDDEIITANDFNELEELFKVVAEL